MELSTASIQMTVIVGATLGIAILSNKARYVFDLTHLLL
jgi:hypothetical protein